MSAKATKWAWKVSGLTAAQKFVLVRLAWRADDEGNVGLAVPELADDCELCERSVRDALRTLEDRKLVATEHRTGRKSSYLLAFRTPAAHAGAPRQRVPKKPRQQVPPPPAARSINPGSRCRHQYTKTYTKTEPIPP